MPNAVSDTSRHPDEDAFLDFFAGQIAQYYNDHARDDYQLRKDLETPDMQTAKYVYLVGKKEHNNYQKRYGRDEVSDEELYKLIHDDPIFREGFVMGAVCLYSIGKRD